MRRNAIHKSVPAALSGNDLDQLCTDNPLQGGVGEAQGQVITATAVTVLVTSIIVVQYEQQGRGLSANRI